MNCLNHKLNYTLSEESHFDLNYSLRYKSDFKKIYNPFFFKRVFNFGSNNGMEKISKYIRNNNFFFCLFKKNFKSKPSTSTLRLMK
jgi:hypothetical protein